MPGPFLSTVLLGGAAIAEADASAQRREWLPRIAAGDAKAALAWTEPNLRWDAAGVAAPVHETSGGFTLSGTKLFVGDVIWPTFWWSLPAPATAARWRTA